MRPGSKPVLAYFCCYIQHTRLVQHPSDSPTHVPRAAPQIAPALSEHRTKDKLLGLFRAASVEIAVATGANGAAEGGAVTGRTATRRASCKNRLRRLPRAPSPIGHLCAPTSCVLQVDLAEVLAQRVHAPAPRDPAQCSAGRYGGDPECNVGVFVGRRPPPRRCRPGHPSATGCAACRE